MKLVFSRKGFDAEYGGMASPILPDGRLVPLSIPSDHDQYTLSDVNISKIDLEGILSDLTRGRLSPATRTHLDPDLNRLPASRLPGWRPAFGQTGIAQSHLGKQNIGSGDVFLFFGWFRKIEFKNGHWRFRPTAPNIHLIFGWLEVSELLPVVLEREDSLRQHPWIANHPHVQNPAQYTDSRNTLYVSAARSRFSDTAAFGGGRFESFSEQLQLTAANHSRSVWRLPKWTMPKGSAPPLTYHANAHRWRQDGDSVILNSVAKGQEFVLDCEAYSEALPWVGNLINKHA